MTLQQVTPSASLRPFRFLELPAELRTVIYYHALGRVSVPLDTCLFGADRRTRNAFSLLYVCKTVYNEAINVLTKHSTLELPINTDPVDSERLYRWQYDRAKFARTPVHEADDIINERKDFHDMCDAALRTIARFRNYRLVIVIRDGSDQRPYWFLDYLACNLNHSAVQGLEVVLSYHFVYNTDDVETFSDLEFKLREYASRALVCLTGYLRGIPRATVTCDDLPNLPHADTGGMSVEKQCARAEALFRQLDVSDRSKTHHSWLLLWKCGCVRSDS